jgi:hypothetical protein
MPLGFLAYLIFTQMGDYFGYLKEIIYARMMMMMKIGIQDAIYNCY